jgi:hypothetical protein
MAKKTGLQGLTYSQKAKRHGLFSPCCKAAFAEKRISRKSLISLMLVDCSADGQSAEWLDFSGFAGIGTGFST